MPITSEGIIVCKHIGHNVFCEIKETMVVKIISELLKTMI